MNLNDTQANELLARLRLKLIKAKENKDKAMAIVIIHQAEAILRSKGIQDKIPFPKWITE